jgi:hypothetical protein
MFRPKSYARACVALSDDKAPYEVHYLFAAGLHDCVHLISEHYQPSTGELITDHQMIDVEEVGRIFGVETYQACKANLGKGSGHLASQPVKALERRLNPKTTDQRLARAVMDTLEKRNG